MSVFSPQRQFFLCCVKKVLTVSGSLRAKSQNTALLDAVALAAGDLCEVVCFPGMGDLPLFNPDIELVEIPAVQAWRRELADAAAVLISSPEYAHGISGVMKNALDWVVGSGEFSGKPVAVFNASSRSHHAHESLLEILRTMDARLIPEAVQVFPFIPKHYSAAEIAVEHRERIRQGVAALLDATISNATG